MNGKIKLSKGLLELILMVQSYMRYLMKAYHFQKSHYLEHNNNWREKSDYYFSLPSGAVIKDFKIIAANVNEHGKSIVVNEF